MKTQLIFFDTIDNSIQGTIRGFIAFISLILLDFIYLSLMSKTNVYYTSKTPINIYSALLVWLILCSAIAVQLPKSFNEAIVYGALVGFVTYSIFNLTNYSILKEWSLNTVIIDTLWGTFNCSFAAGILYLIYWKNK